MADEIVPNAAPQVAQPVATEAAASSATPQVTESTQVVPVEQAIAPILSASEPAPAKPAEAASDAAAAAESALLAPEKPAVETKPADGEKQVEGEKKAEGDQSDEPASLPTYEPFVLPEGLKFEESALGDFTKSLAEFENSPKTHEEVQKFGQSLVDRHIAAIQTALTRQIELQQIQKTDQRKEWIGKFNADPEIGGNRRETSLREAKEFIKTHAPKSSDAFYNALAETGADAHPDIVRFLLEVKNSSTFKTPQQLAAPKPVSEPKSKIEKRYGTKS
jgi:hypothetical protein